MIQTASPLEQALHDPSFWRRAAALRAWRQEPADLDRLRLALRHEDWRIRRRAVRLLARLSPPDLRAALPDSAWQVRRAAAALVRDPEAHAELLPLLADPIAPVREAAAESLGHLLASDALAAGVKSAVAAGLLAALEDRDDAVREQAAGALSSTFLDRECLPALRRALEDESSLVRSTVASMIAAFGPDSESETALLGLLATSSRSVLLAAVAALGRAGGRPAVEHLLALLDGDGECRVAAVNALAQLGQRVAGVEEDLLRLLDAGPVRRRLGIAQALGLLGSHAALTKVRAWLGADRWPVRRRGVRALAGFASLAPELTADLESRLHDSHARVRRAAVETAGALGRDALPLLPAILKRLHEQDRGVRVASLRALRQLLPHASEHVRSWLALLCEARRGPGHQVRALLRLDVSASVRAEFQATCVRRGQWFARLAGQPESPDVEAKSAWQAARAAARQAGARDTRKITDSRETQRAARAARRAEHSWQLALLGKLLLGAAP
jgi:HEAT repeat protein